MGPHDPRLHVRESVCGGPECSTEGREAPDRPSLRPGSRAVGAQSVPAAYIIIEILVLCFRPFQQAAPQLGQQAPGVAPWMVAHSHLRLWHLLRLRVMHDFSTSLSCRTVSQAL